MEVGNVCMYVQQPGTKAGGEDGWMDGEWLMADGARVAGKGWRVLEDKSGDGGGRRALAVRCGRGLPQLAGEDALFVSSPRLPASLAAWRVHTQTQTHTHPHPHPHPPTPYPRIPVAVPAKRRAATLGLARAGLSSRMRP